MASRPRRGYSGVDDSIVELIAIIGIIVVALTLVLVAGFAETFGSSTVLTLAKAIMPGLVIVGVVIFGRRAVYLRGRNLDDGAVIALGTVGAFAAIVIAVIVAILVGSDSVQNTLQDIITKSLGITGVVAGAIVGFGAGGAAQSRRSYEAAPRSNERPRRFDSGVIAILAVIIAFVIIMLALIIAIVTGDSQVPSSLVDLVQALEPIIGATLGITLGFMGGLYFTIPMRDRGEEIEIDIIEPVVELEPSTAPEPSTDPESE